MCVCMICWRKTASPDWKSLFQIPVQVWSPSDWQWDHRSALAGSWSSLISGLWSSILVASVSHLLSIHTGMWMNPGCPLVRLHLLHWCCSMSAGLARVLYTLNMHKSSQQCDKPQRLSSLITTDVSPLPLMCLVVVRLPCGCFNGQTPDVLTHILRSKSSRRWILNHHLSKGHKSCKKLRGFYTSQWKKNTWKGSCWKLTNIISPWVENMVQVSENTRSVHCLY